MLVSVHLFGCNAADISFEPYGPSEMPPVTIDGSRDRPVGAGGAGAMAVFEAEVAPRLDLSCGACHKPQRVGPPFLEPRPDVRSGVLAWPGLVDLARPAESYLITRGTHAGPAWTRADANLIRGWIELEAAERGSPITTDGGAPTVIATTPMPIVTEGANTIDLGEVGGEGARVTFEATIVGTGFVFSSIEAIAGERPLRIVHPRVVTWTNNRGTPDRADRFASLDLVIGPRAREPLGDGRFVLADLSPEARVCMSFERVELLDAPMLPPDLDGGMPDAIAPPPVVCNATERFRTYVRPHLDSECTGCHGTDTLPLARAAFDLTPSLLNATVCSDVLSRIDPDDITTSMLLIATDPVSESTHSFKHSREAHQAFVDDLERWLAYEE